MSDKQRIVIVGATGEVGAALFSALEDADFQNVSCHAVASANSVDETVMFNGRALLVEALNEFDFQKDDIVVFAAPANITLQVAPQLRKQGCRLIDLSGAYALDENIPLVISGDSVPDAEFVSCASPLAAVLAQIVNALSPHAPISSIQATILKPASSYGRAGVRELAGQTGELLNARGITPAVFPAQIAFNTLPLVGEMNENKLMDELERLLPESVPVALMEAVSSVFYGAMVGLSIQTTQEILLSKAETALSKVGMNPQNNEEDQELVTPVTHASGVDGVVFTGLQALPAPFQGLRLWLLMDLVRQGAVKPTLDILSKWIKRL